MELPLPHSALRDQQLMLRGFTTADIDRLIILISEQPLAERRPAISADYRSALAWLSRIESQRREGAHWEIGCWVERRLVGSVSLDQVDQSLGRAEISCWLAPAVHGQGYGPRMLRLAARFIFSELGIGRLTLLCHPDHHQARRLAENAGFQEEGRLRGWLPDLHGRQDQQSYSLLASDLGITSVVPILTPSSAMDLTQLPD